MKKFENCTNKIFFIKKEFLIFGWFKMCPVESLTREINKRVNA